MLRLTICYGVAAALASCEMGIGQTEGNNAKSKTCKAVEVLVQAPDALPICDVSLGLDETAFRESVSECLEHDTCGLQSFGLWLPRQVRLSNGEGVTAVRAKLANSCSECILEVRYFVSILVNRAGHILCEGEAVGLDQVKECYRSTFSTALAEGYRVAALDISWSGEHPSLIGEIVAQLVEEHWAVIDDHASEKYGIPTCDLSEEALRELAEPFAVILQRTERLKPPPLPVH